MRGAFEGTSMRVSNDSSESFGFATAASRNTRIGGPPTHWVGARVLRFGCRHFKPETGQAVIALWDAVIAPFWWPQTFVDTFQDT